MGGLLDRYRQPGYTGEDRCLPCTVVNAVIAVVVGNAVFALLVGLERPPAVAAAGAVLTIALGGVQIWLRGYLIPGTPTLTERYFPPWVLRAFGKQPFLIETPGVDADERMDVETHLLEAGALQYDATGTDLELDGDFRRRWRRAIQRVDDVDGAVLEVFDVDGTVTVERTDRRLTVFVDNQPLGRWASRAALIADLAGGRTLADRDDAWADRSTAERGQLVNGLRLYIESCPECGGETALDTETTTSCCTEYEVATVACLDCGVRLFELPVEAIAEA